MVLRLSPDHLQMLASHAAQAYPQECCGLLLGRGDTALDPGAMAAEPDAEPDTVVMEVVPLRNAWTPEVAELMATALPGASQASPRVHSQVDRYWIDPQDLMGWQRTARDRGLNIVGIFHSHPDHPALPSECDRLLAWSGYAYIIISVCNGEPADLRCWRLDDDHRFQAEPMESGPPPRHPSDFPIPKRN